jgi:hypothetical protein
MGKEKTQEHLPNLAAITANGARWACRKLLRVNRIVIVARKLGACGCAWRIAAVDGGGGPLD